MATDDQIGHATELSDRELVLAYLREINFGLAGFHPEPRRNNIRFWYTQKELIVKEIKHRGLVAMLHTHHSGVTDFYFQDRNGSEHWL